MLIAPRPILPLLLLQKNISYQKEYYLNLFDFVNKEYQEKRCFPPYVDIFNAFKFVELNCVKVVILGQDPYHRVDEANGLAFSVNDGVKLPPSLKNIFKELEDLGAENINLVTPTSYVLHIIEAIKIARKRGLTIPIVYNTNGYENIETIKLLEGYIDIYLPDLKYYFNEIAKKYSNIDNYFEVATNAIKEMYRQVGVPQINENGIMQKGLMIRHLVLPNNLENSKQVLKWIKDNIDNNVYVSIMAQYFPTYKAKNVDDLARKLTKQEYEEIENYLYDLDLENGYIQELGEHEEEYVPKWDI